MLIFSKFDLSKIPFANEKNFEMDFVKWNGAAQIPRWRVPNQFEL